MSLQIGPYKIISELGSGGMGVVYRALDTQISREVALKRLRSEFAASPAVMNRFRNEAKLQGRLNHEGIAQLYSLFQSEGVTCIVMEFVDGARLKDLIPLTYELAAMVMVQVLNALGHAHRLGVLHRDIKPENIIIDRTGKVKVMDFGIAYAVGSERMTREKSMVGTIEYMAPERILGKEVTNTSDIYSLGVLLFECLTGRLPMDTIVEYELLRWHIENDPPPIHLYSNVPSEFDRIIQLAMKKNPELRYRCCEEMAADLAPFISNIAPATERLQHLVTEVHKTHDDLGSADLRRIYERILELLHADDFPSAERFLRQQADRYPKSAHLATDARLASEIMVSGGSIGSNCSTSGDTERTLFCSLMLERVGSQIDARTILIEHQRKNPASVLAQLSGSA